MSISSDLLFVYMIPAGST